MDAAIARLAPQHEASMSGQSQLLDNGVHRCPDCGEQWECFLHAGCDSLRRIETSARCPDCSARKREADRG